MLLCIKRFLLAAGLFLLTAMATFVALLSTDADKVKGMLISELNRRVNTEFTAADLHFSLIKDFPMASFRFQEVLVMEPPHSEKPDTLAYASSVALNFNLLDFFRGEYNIRRLTVSDGVLYPKKDANGEKNYLLWQSSSRGNQSEVQFDIKRIDLDNVRMKYLHQVKDQFMDIHFHQIRIHTKPDQDNYLLTAEGSATGHTIDSGNRTLFENIEVEAKLHASFGAENFLRITESHFAVYDYDVFADGDMYFDEGRVYADLNLRTRELATESLLEKLPESWKQPFKPLGLSGKLATEIHIKGHLDNVESPGIHASYTVSQGHVSLQRHNISADINTLQGSFTKTMQSPITDARIDIHKLEASSEDAELRGNISISKFQRPEIAFELNAQISPEKLVAFFPHESLSRTGGHVDMDIAFNGSMSHDQTFTHEDLLDSRLSGEVTLKDVRFIVNENTLLPYHQINAHMVFQDNNLHMKHLNGNAGSSDFAVSGVIQNVLPYLFVDGEHAVIQARLNAGHINMDEILQQQTHETDTIYRLNIPSRLQLHLHADVGEFRFREFRANHVNGQARISDRQFFADYLELESMGGKVLMEGLVDGRQEDSIHISCHAKMTNVDIHQLFLQTGNFGQHGIRHDHIHGRVTADMHFSSSWSPQLEIDWGSMETSASLSIEEGRLINYHPLIALGRYLRTSDLSHVRFSTLENEIHIKNRLISIPQMEIASSALDLQLSGQHTFDNEIDYRIQVLLSDILAREHRERRNPQEQYGEIIDDGLHTTLFLKLTGDFNNPRFSYDRSGAREQWRDNLRAERENLRQILRDEFRFRSREPEKDTSDQDTIKERREKQESGEFIIEWEELE